jgi:tRNA threonylcarbamoyladenosine biosynthesis protein TsaE
MGMKWWREGELLAVRSESEADTDRLGRHLSTIVKPGLVIGLVGELGAGKTRLVRSIAEALGADPEAIASPTFVLIHEYSASLPIYHFDAYRLESIERFEALGVDEYFYGDGVCLVEWADRVRTCLPPDAWWIYFEREGTNRVIRLQLDPASVEVLSAAL